MRKTALILATALLLPQFAAAQMRVAPQTPQAAPVPLQRANPQAALDNVRRITIDEANRLMQQQKAVMVDVRSKEQFDLGHIKGAVHIPGSQLLRRLRELPPGLTIITYCACSAEQSSGRAVIELNNHGVKNTAALLGGWASWQEAGLPTAKTR